MGATPPAGYGMVRLVWNVSGRPDPIIVTFGCVTTTLPDLEATAAAIYDSFTGDGFPIYPVGMPLGYTFQGVEVSAGPVGEQETATFLEPIVGTGVSQPLPPNCCLLIRKNTSRGGRKGRGRCYWPPYHADESQVDAAGNFTSAFISSHQPLFNAALAQCLSNSAALCLLHEDGSTPNAITSLALQQTIATQRRRVR